MNRVLMIARREYKDTIMTKTFIFGVVLAPIIMITILIFAAKMSQTDNKPREAVTVWVVDRTEKLAPQIVEGFAKYNKKNPVRLITAEVEKRANEDAAFDSKLKGRLVAGSLDIYIVLDPNIIAGSGQSRIFTHKLKAVNADAVGIVCDIINKVVVNERCQIKGLSRAELSAIWNVNYSEIEVDKSKGEGKKGQAAGIMNMMVPFAFMYLMFMGVVAIGPHMISGLIEEKSSRIMEVLLSAVSPQELMFGKILGLGGVGLSVMGLWAVVAYGGASWKELPIYISPRLMTWFAVYYVLGFLLFGALMAGIGSVCNTLKETQSIIMPITMLMVVPMVTWANLAQSPNGVWARVLSFIPPMTPLVMIVRLASGSEVWWVERVATVVVLAISVLVAIWAAGKVFRVGILMYGKRPSLAEMGRIVLQK
jgi:ABC-2 type transport system permease protein